MRAAASKSSPHTSYVRPASIQDTNLVPCRNPLVSLAYEKGWRQSFAWAGFPGQHWTLTMFVTTSAHRLHHEPSAFKRHGPALLLNTNPENLWLTPYQKTHTICRRRG